MGWDWMELCGTFYFFTFYFVFCFLFCISGEEGNGKIKEDFIDDFMGRGILGFGIWNLEFGFRSKDDVI